MTLFTKNRKERTLYLHIGMHKTGTSSAQFTLAQDRHKPFYYPDIGVNHSIPLYNIFCEHPEKYHVNIKNGFSSEEIEKYKSTITSKLAKKLKSVNKDFFISGEDISSLSKEGVIRLKEYFEPHFSRIKIIAYIRPPKSFIESSLQQRIKGGLNRFKPEVSYPKYQKRFQNFSTLFDRKDIEFVLYNKKSLKEGCVVIDICSRAGYNIEPSKVVKSNESISLDALKILYTYRKAGGEFGSGKKSIEKNKKLMAILSAMPGNKLTLSESIVRPILKANEQDIKWMEEQLGESLIEDLSDNPDSIASEKDLLNISPECIKALLDTLTEY